jgi:anti-sigma factor RsiW
MRRDISCADFAPLAMRMIDGEVAVDERVRAETHLMACDGCRAELASQTELGRLVKNGLAQYSAPDVLKAKIHSALLEASGETPMQSKPGRSHRAFPLLAAGIALLVATNVVTFSVTRAARGDGSTVDGVLASHVRSLLPGHLLDVTSTDQHNVKPWFNGRTAMSPPVPSLEASDFHLVGGRLDYVAEHPAAAVVYSRRQHMINVFAWASSESDASESTRTSRGYHLVTWRGNGIEFWVVSDLNLAELHAFTKAYRGADVAR